MTKHTPGPWNFDGPADNIIVWSGPENRICFMTSNGPANANARLISAAPQLLEVVQLMQGANWKLDDDVGMEIRRRALAAVQKATDPIAASPDANPRLQLKPLEWSEQHQTHYASNLFGGYSVWEIGGNTYLRAPGDYGGKIVGKTIEDGKLAAVRDIEDRIAALLVDPPANPRERGTE